MGLSPLTFVGVSQFSEDFQTILSRAVQIAELPIQALQNRDSDVLQQKTLLSDLSASIASLATSLSGLGTTASNQALAATSSNTTAVSVINSGATVAASYTINSITSVAAAASERTVGSYADSASTPVSSTGDVKLVVGSDEYDLTLTNNSLVGLRDQINALGAGVSASILTTADGNYLSVSATASGETTLRLFDDPLGANTNLLTADNQGSNAVFQLNGIDIEQSQNVVNAVVPGLTFTIQEATEAPVTLQLATDRSQLSSALQSFVGSYNAVRSKVNQQVGPAAGLLSGNFLVGQLQSRLREIASYRDPSGSVTSLSDLGIVFDSSGEASFDTTTFNALTDAAISDAFSYIGSATEGLGGLSDGLEQFSDPISGLIKLEQDGLDRIDRSLQDRIDALYQRIDVMRTGLNLRLQQADTLLAGLESQQNLLTASLEGLSMVLYGRKDQSS